MITTKSTPVNVSANVLVGANAASNNVPGTVTTTPVSLTQTFTVEGTREEAGIARGTVTLHNETDRPQPLVRTTRLLTPEGVLFRMDEARTVPARGTVDVPVYADQPGASGNIGPTERFTIPGLDAVKQQVIYASSAAPMSGGVRQIGAVTQADIDRAQKQLAAAITQRAGELFPVAAPEGHATIYSVDEVTTQTTAELGAEVDRFEVTASGRLVAVTYDVAALNEWGRTELQKRSIGDAENVMPGSDKPQVSFAAYDATTGIATLGAYFDGIVTLNPESKQIEKAVFFGKSKDEVRRYLLSLDHVHKVDVEFDPVWMQTVPHIYDHVTVIVKEVE